MLECCWKRANNISLSVFAENATFRSFQIYLVWYDFPSVRSLTVQTVAWAESTTSHQDSKSVFIAAELKNSGKQCDGRKGASSRREFAGKFITDCFALMVPLLLWHIFLERAIISVFQGNYLCHLYKILSQSASARLYIHLIRSHLFQPLQQNWNWEISKKKGWFTIYVLCGKLTNTTRTL